MFIQYTLVRIELLSDHLLVNSCPLGEPFVLHCFLVYFYWPSGFRGDLLNPWTDDRLKSTKMTFVVVTLCPGPLAFIGEGLDFITIP